jgi:hypothetical protein
MQMTILANIMAQEFEIFFALASAILISIGGVTWKKLNKIQRISFIIGIITTLFISYNQYTKNEREKLIARIEAKIGNIEDIDGATFPEFEFDDSGSRLVNTGKDKTFFATEEGPLIKLYVIKNKLYVTTIIRNRNGNVIAAIEDNEWEMVSDDYDYNNDDQAFELVSRGDRKVFFHVNLKDGAAQVGGFLLDKTGFGFFTFTSYNAKGEKNGGMMNFIRDKDDLAAPNSIHPIFKYPRKTHLGERIIAQH